MSEHAQELVSIAVTLLAISNPKGIAVVIVCAGFFLIQMLVLGEGGRYLIPILFPLGTYIAVGKNVRDGDREIEIVELDCLFAQRTRALCAAAQTRCTDKSHDDKCFKFHTTMIYGSVFSYLWYHQHLLQMLPFNIMVQQGTACPLYRVGRGHCCPFPP